MTLPSEELRTLKQTREVLRTLLNMKKSELVGMPIGDFRELVYSCLRHYPFNCTLDSMWEKRIEEEI